ncbi:gliding motility-associated C-terminal domain-containing protein, partial [Salmonella sp. SAL4360]|uniref:T9SS type B sorting domain-containing protein n=1 Tax=Salmonella sp. SAL4360 TaxID=3159881 RepID=UPI00397C7870
FTPNNDGTNDRIKVLYKGDMKLITFMIFNRFGQMVFSSNSLTDSWDGNFNGKPQDLGVYNYYMRAVCGNRGTEEIEFKGTIT